MPTPLPLRTREKQKSTAPRPEFIAYLDDDSTEAQSFMRTSSKAFRLSRVTESDLGLAELAQSILPAQQGGLVDAQVWGSLDEVLNFIAQLLRPRLDLHH